MLTIIIAGRPKARLKPVITRARITGDAFKVLDRASPSHDTGKGPDHVPAGSSKGGQFMSGVGGGKKISKKEQARTQWDPKDQTNKTGNLKRSPFGGALDPSQGTFGLQTAIKNQIPKWEKGTSLQQRNESLKQWVAGKMPPVKVSARQLMATQFNITRAGQHEGKAPLFSTIGGEYPVIAKLPDGSLQVIDGHHRVDKAAAAGEHVMVRVIPIKGPESLSFKPKD